MRQTEIKTIDEVAMNPTAYASSTATAAGKNVLIGFEFEVCVPRTSIQQGINFVEMPAELTTNLSWLDQVSIDKFVDFLSQNRISVAGSPFKLQGSRASLATSYKLWFIDTVIRPLANEFYKDLFNDYQNFIELKPVFDRMLQQADAAWHARSSASRGNYVSNVCYNVATGFAREKYRQMSELGSESEYNRFFHQIHEIEESLQESLSTQQLPSTIRTYLSRITAGATTVGELVRAGKLKIDGARSATAQGTLRQLWSFASGNRSIAGRTISGYGADTAARQFVSDLITPSFGDVKIFRDYHQAPKNATSWYIEPDGSLNANSNDGTAEVVSPPMPVPKAIAALKEFYLLADKAKLYTNNSTGLHINMSIPDDTDIVKLMLFLGENYVLQTFGRENNSYTRRILRAAIENAKSRSDLNQRQLLNDPAAERVLNNVVKSISRDHFSSINFNGKYFSFRHAGGDYLKKPEEIFNTVGRFVRALLIASDPDAERQEYLKKLSKFSELVLKKPADRIQDRSRIRELMQTIRTDGVYGMECYFVNEKPDMLTSEAFKNLVESQKDGIWTWRAGTDQDIAAFTERGHSLSDESKERTRRLGPENMHVATFVVNNPEKAVVSPQSTDSGNYPVEMAQNARAIRYDGDRVGVKWGKPVSVGSTSEAARKLIAILRQQYLRVGREQ